MASLLEIAVDSRRNILVSGAPGSGRTMLLGALAGAARDNERLITIEDGEDLALRQPNWIQLTTRGGPREAIESALRLRPDRLIIDDVHSPSDALAVIAATAALPGAMASINGASATDAITRLEGLALLAKGAPDVQTLREVMAQSIHVIVQLGRAQDGAMRIVEVAEVTGIAEGGHPALADVYLFKPDEGRFSATGHVPAFATGAPPSLFRL